MSCKIEFKTKEYLQGQDIINDKNEILDLNKFKAQNDYLTSLAYSKYNVGEDNVSLFTVDSSSKVASNGEKITINKIVSNDTLFNMLEEAVEIDNTDDLTTNLPDLLTTLGTKIFQGENLIDTSEVRNNNSDLANRINTSVSRILNSINENISKSTYFSKVIKDTVKAARVKDYLNKLEVLKKDIDSYGDANKVQGIVTFTDFMATQLANLENRLDKVDHTSKEDVRDAVRLHDNYLKAFSVVDKLESLISEIRQTDGQKFISSAELMDLEKKLIKAKGEYSYLGERLLDLKKKSTKFLLNDIKYFPKVETRHRNRLEKEYKQSGIVENKTEWIIDKMNNRDKDLIQLDLNLELENLINNESFDIYSSDVMFSSAINVSSDMIQIMNQLLTEIDNERIKSEMAKDKEFKALFDKLVAEKGTNNINKLYENILDYDSNGKAYIKSEYKATFYSDVDLKIKNINREYKQKILDKKIQLKLARPGSQSYINLNKEIKALSKEKRNIINKIRFDNLNIINNKTVGINDKWLNKDVTLSETEKEVRDFFKSIIDESHKSTYGQDSLRTFSYGTMFYELPKVTKSDIERVWSGKTDGIIKDKWKDLTEVRPDDVGYSARNIDLNNEQIKKLRIHYRDNTGNFSNKDQSLDLFTIMRMEYKNANMYKIRSAMEQDLNFLVDIAKNKEYNQREGTQKIINMGTKKLNAVKGADTNTYKMMNNILESRFYDIMNKNGTKLGKADMNKVVGFINKSSSFLALSLNIASGTANVLNANAQLFLESFIKGRTIKASSIKKANLIYSKDMPNILRDVTNPINESFTNQLNELFNSRGLFNLSDANFLQSDLVKKGLDAESLQVFQQSGEHWVQSIITMSVLDGVKVMNANGKFINKEGKVTTEEKAASLLDMAVTDPDTGVLSISDKVVYTTHSKMSKWNEGGKEKVDALVRKKTYDSIGNYTESDQPDVMRHWLGKLLMLYRRYLVPMGQSRLRGIEYSLKTKDQLTEDEKRYSYALQEYEEGTYTTTIRYIASAIKEKQYNILSRANWDKLTDYEKHNIKRSVVELILTSVILPLASALVAGAADGEDDDYLFFIAYQLRRMETELSAYRDITETFKMMRSPIPSARLLETGKDLMLQTFQPWTWDDEYKAGPNKGKSKYKTKILKQIPVVKEFQRTYEDLYNFQDSTVGTGL